MYEKGILTILKQQSGRGGLQVRHERDGSHNWVDAAPAKGCFVVNIGDLLMRWTNDKWMSNAHRVVSPDVQPGQCNRRQSIAFFFNANPDTCVECFPSCVGEGAKYEKIEAGEYLMQQHNKATSYK